MADYYVEFSETLPQLSAAEAAWLANQLQCVVLIGETEYSADQVSDLVDAETVIWHGPRFLRGATGYEESPEQAAFCYEFCEDTADGQCTRYLWLYSEDHADLEQVALLVQKFLREFRPQAVWTMTYATTCSKLRYGAFGGGAGIVTADAIVWHDAQAIAEAAHQPAASALRPAT